MVIRVFKGNVEYRVSDEKKQEYLDLGYSVLDDDGHVIIQGRPVTLADYKQRVSEMETTLKRCEVEYEELNARFVALKSAYDTLEASVRGAETKSTSGNGDGSNGKSKAKTGKVSE